MGRRRQIMPYIRAENQPLCVTLLKCTKSHSLLVKGRDGRWQQFHTKCSLNSSPSGTVYPIMGCYGFTRSQNDASESRAGYL